MRRECVMISKLKEINHQKITHSEPPARRHGSATTHPKWKRHSEFSGIGMWFAKSQKHAKPFTNMVMLHNNRSYGLLWPFAR